MRGLPRFVMVLAAALSVGLAGACATSWDEYDEAYGGSAEEGAEGAQAADFEQDSYRLGSGDLVNILVFNQPDLSGEVAVDGGGEVTIPLLGSVDAGGKTASDLGDDIERGLRSAGLLRNPQVTVQVMTFRPFYIDGEVEAPGGYPYVDGLTVRGAITIAGGYTDRANRNRVYILREGESQERSIRIRVDTPVQPGDQLRVPDRAF